MPWRFVGRAEQLEQVCRALEGPASGPIVLAGEPGMGRTALVSRAIARVDGRSTRIVQVKPSGSAPLSALQTSLPGRVPASLNPDDAARAVGRALGRVPGRTVIVADDAHLMDHASVLALRSLSRLGDATLLATHPLRAESASRPDPTDCLAYEQNTLSVLLPPFTVDEVADLVGHLVGGTVRAEAAQALRAVAGGNPRMMRELLVAEGLAGSLVLRQGEWSIDAVGAGRGAGAWCGDDGLRANAAGLSGAIEKAWRDLAIDQLDQLCRTALWCGATDQVDTIWPFLLILRGRMDEAIEFLYSLGDGAMAAKPQLALLRALAVAVGHGQPQAAARFLLSTASGGVGPPGLLAAYGAWLLTVAGQVNEAASALRTIRHTDRETALFVHAARAGVTRLGGQAAETVFHLRRALATAEGCGDSYPWMRSYLSVCLDDALIVAGRGTEVDSVTTRLRSRESASGRYAGEILRALALTASEACQARPSRLSPPWAKPRSADPRLALRLADRAGPGLAGPGKSARIVAVMAR